MKFIRTKILQYEKELSCLKPNIENSDLTATLYNQILIKKAVLKQQIQFETKNFFKNLLISFQKPKEKKICEYFKAK